MNTKVCNTCGEEKPLELFSFKDKAKDIRRATCKTCVSKWDKDNYTNSDSRRTSIRQRAKVNRKKNQGVVANYLRTHPCVDCGESDIVVLDFDHVRGTKSFNISQRLLSISEETLFEEIEKCDVRCANCHRRATAKRDGRYYRMLG